MDTLLQGGERGARRDVGVCSIPVKPTNRNSTAGLPSSTCTFNVLADAGTALVKALPRARECCVAGGWSGND